MRNHACLGTRPQELFRFKRIDDFRNLINLRYALIPYLYSEYMKAIINNDLMFKPLSFKYSDDLVAREIEDELLVGESIMIAPIYKQNTNARYVYLPEDMRMIRFRSYNDFDSEYLAKGHHYLKASLNELLVFILPGKLLPLTKPKGSVEELDFKNLSYLVNKESEYSYYYDDGLSKEINGEIKIIKASKDNI